MKKTPKNKPKSTGRTEDAHMASEPVVSYAPKAKLGRIVPARRQGQVARGRERIGAIRQGHDYSAIELLSTKIDASVKELLPLFELAQTTYNKKKRGQERMGRRDTEMLVYLNELIDYGIEVFDNEQAKFQRWLRKPNLSLGGVTPFSLLDTITGMREVRGCLDRIEYGNLA